MKKILQISGIIFGGLFILGLIVSVVDEETNSPTATNKTTIPKQDSFLDNEKSDTTETNTTTENFEIDIGPDEKEDQQIESNGELQLVIRVIDGDTIELASGERVRYIGIDTPETIHPSKPVQCFGKEASAKNAELVLNKEVRLEKDINNTDQYGRLLRYIYVGNIFVNLELVKQGYAYASSYPPDVKYQGLFQDAQSEAQSNDRGLWSACEEEETIQESNELVEQTPIVTTEPTGSCSIKGNISSKDEKIYHYPGCPSYKATKIDESKGERWFCNNEEAKAAGWRQALNC